MRRLRTTIPKKSYITHLDGISISSGNISVFSDTTPLLEVIWIDALVYVWRILRELHRVSIKYSHPSKYNWGHFYWQRLAQISIGISSWINNYVIVENGMYLIIHAVPSMALSWPTGEVTWMNHYIPKNAWVELLIHVIIIRTTHWEIVHDMTSHLPFWKCEMNDAPKCIDDACLPNLFVGNHSPCNIFKRCH